jgi:hypothetical protein
LDVMLML